MEESQPESRSRAADLEDILNQASEETAHRARVRAEAPPVAQVTRSRGVAGALAFAVPLLAIFLAVNVFDVSVVDLMMPAPSPAVALRETQDALEEMVKGIESYRQDYEELPEHLTEVAPPFPGQWTYSRKAGGHYQVVLEMHGQVITYDSAQNKQLIHEPHP
jgi:hypothetical protein